MERFIVVLLMLLSVVYGFADKKNEKTAETHQDYIELKNKTHAPNTRSVIIEENPVISIQGVILSFITDLPSCTLQLVDETGNYSMKHISPKGQKSGSCLQTSWKVASCGLS